MRNSSKPCATYDNTPNYTKVCEIKNFKMNNIMSFL